MIFRNIDLTEEEIKNKLILTHKEVNDVVLFVKNGGYFKKYLNLVSKLNETIKKISQDTGLVMISKIPGYCK